MCPHTAVSAYTCVRILLYMYMCQYSAVYMSLFAAKKKKSWMWQWGRALQARTGLGSALTHGFSLVVSSAVTQGFSLVVSSADARV